MTKITLDFIFGKFPRTNPIDTIPSIKIDLKAISKNVILRREYRMDICRRQDSLREESRSPMDSNHVHRAANVHSRTPNGQG